MTESTKLDERIANQHERSIYPVRVAKIVMQ